MDYDKLKELTAEVRPEEAKDYRKLFSYVTVAGNVAEPYRKHLGDAETLQEFYDAIYADDDLKRERAWGQWAKMSKKSWISRFVPEQATKVRLQTRGVFVQAKDGNNELLIPLPVHNRIVDICRFGDMSINEEAGDFYGSIYGSFTCEGIDLEGAFDIYLGPLAVAFERWDTDKMNTRAHGRGTISAGSCCMKIWSAEEAGIVFPEV